MKPDYISVPDWELLLKKYPNKEELLDKLTNYPPQYLIGNVEFLGQTINVDKRVLIPRFETELLVDKTIKYAKELFNKKINVIDLGTGSGCIAISLKNNLDANVTALDISKDALDLAKKNAKLNNAEITFINNSMTEDLQNNYDIIISNPPYIPYDGFVEEKVKKTEPNIALFADNNGLYFYEEIIKNSSNYLNDKNIIAFEIGYLQANEIKKMSHKYYPNSNIIIEKDMQEKDRFVFIINL